MDPDTSACEGTLPTKPRLRAVEAHPWMEGQEAMIVVRDPSGLTDVNVTLSRPALYILSLMDGEHTLEDIQREFFAQLGLHLRRDLLDDLVQNLERAHLLEGPGFEAHYGRLLADYRAAATRPIRDLRGLGFDDGQPTEELGRLFDFSRRGDVKAQVLGIVSPHLDYRRGQPCYQEAYATLLGGPRFQRFVILGTNHFGRSLAPVATTKNFETPLGVSIVDVDFLEELEQRCGHSLRRYELDHQCEHSIELQVMLLQHLVGAEEVTFVPILCPDPCGPTGTAPLDGDGVDLKDLACVLRTMLTEDATPTCLIAGADLSHIGGFFGDTRPLSHEFLEEVRDRDQAVLRHIQDGQPEPFRARVAEQDNPTRICSAGCLYAILMALPQARFRLLQYHQAVNHDAQCAVTCVAGLFELP